MNRILMLVCALALATAASAQLYKSVDKDGRITYSDQPPPALESKQLKIDPAPAGTPAPSARERVKELDKSRAAEREKAKSEEEKAKRAKADAERCERAKVQLRSLDNGGRFTSLNAQGERVFLDEAQVAAERERAQKAVDESCKSS